jgi:CheY-like chemotaxis protein
MTLKTSTYRILIAEDDLLLQNVYRTIFNPFGEIIVADNGKKAKEILSSTPNINLFITDNDMPHTTGLELLAQTTSSIQFPCLMISGTSEPRYLHQQAQQHGALGLYEKPFSSIKQLRTIASELLTQGHSPTLDSYFEQKYN